MELKEILYETADRLAKGADSIVKMSELLIEEKVLKNELEKQFNALGKMMYKWYLDDSIEFDMLKSHFKDIDKNYNDLKKIDEILKESKSN